MALSRDDVRQVARLAYLELPRVQDKNGAWIEPDEHLLDDATLDRWARELGKILEHVAELEQLDVSGIEPTSHGVPLPPRLREDRVEDELPRERALALAPKAVADAFSVPKVIE